MYRKESLTTDPNLMQPCPDGAELKHIIRDILTWASWSKTYEDRVRQSLYAILEAEE